MENDLSSAMRRALELVRAGNPAGATEIIQTSLRGAGPLPVRGSAPKLDAELAVKDVSLHGRRRGLRETLETLAAGTLKRGPCDAEQARRPLADGAWCGGSRYACQDGSRDYRIYVPPLASKPPAGLIMMLHGCTQSPVDFANGTDMDRLAEAHRLIAVYPGQCRGANMQSCWNWFGPADQHRNAGEPAILAGLAMQLQREHDVPAEKTFVAGLSAGAAMAIILGHTYPDIFAAVGAHSGLPYKSAQDVASAFAAMGGRSTRNQPANANTVPTIVFHGTTDTVVSPVNGQRIADAARSPGVEVCDEGDVNGRTFTRTSILSPTGATTMEHWRIDGLGHAWSGGSATGSYTDVAGPDASAEIVRFFLNLPTKGN